MNAKLTLATLAGTAVLVIPGAGLIQTAVAADDATGPATTEQQAPGFLPTQAQEAQPESRPRPEDCPEKDGQGGGSGGGSGSSGDSGSSGSGTAL